VAPQQQRGQQEVAVHSTEDNEHEEHEESELFKFPRKLKERHRRCWKPRRPTGSTRWSCPDSAVVQTSVTGMTSDAAGIRRRHKL
jgi:hypothetical protein